MQNHEKHVITSSFRASEITGVQADSEFRSAERRTGIEIAGKIPTGTAWGPENYGKIKIIIDK